MGHAVKIYMRVNEDWNGEISDLIINENNNHGI